MRIVEDFDALKAGEAAPPDTGGVRGRPHPLNLKWMAILETGIPEIDHWHHKLVDDCNRLLSLETADAGWLVVVERTWTLIANCVEHFRVEEAIMERTGFQRLRHHAMEHRRIEQEIRALAARIEGADGTLPEHHQLLNTLGSAMVELMVRHDLDYRSHLLHGQGR